MTPLPPDPDAETLAYQRRNEYVEANLDLVDAIARSLVRRLPPCFELDDLKQAGAMGLLRAAELYSRCLNVPFRFYAQIRIRGEMIETVRRRRYRDATADPLDDQAAELPGPSNVVAMDAGIEQRQMCRRVATALEGLDQDDRDALRIYFLEEKRLAGVGERFGVRSSRSSQIVKRALGRARQACAVHGIARVA
jgi:RNA polymerase sigma factor (sigma-70 family)